MPIDKAEVRFLSHLCYVSLPDDGKKNISGAHRGFLKKNERVSDREGDVRGLNEIRDPIRVDRMFHTTHEACCVWM